MVDTYSFDYAQPFHAQRHRAGGPDAITPQSINALPASQSYLTGDLNDAPEGVVRLGQFDLPNMPTNEVGFLTTHHPVSGANPSARGHGVQTYVSRPSGQVYVRTASGDVWGDWVRIDAGSVTPASIGASGTGHTHTINGVSGLQAALDDKAPLQDTGWRLLSPENGWTGEIRLRRFGPVVHFRARSLSGVAATSSNVIQIPAGFKPGPNLPAHGMGNKSSNAQSGSDPIGSVGGTSNDLVRTFGTITSWTNGSASIEWMTSDSWPSTLPGTPA